MIYTLKNTGTEILEWEADVDVQWITLSSKNGMILPGTSEKIIININAFTKTLYQGKYTGIITFKNKTVTQNPILKKISLIISPFTIEMGPAILSVEEDSSTSIFRREGNPL